jgi:hypothetical protein
MFTLCIACSISVFVWSVARYAPDGAVWSRLLPYPHGGCVGVQVERQIRGLKEGTIEVKDVVVCMLHERLLSACHQLGWRAVTCPLR